MQIPLEDLEYQRRAIAAAVDVLDGQVKNTFDNSNLFGIQANITDLTPEQLEANKKRIIAENSIAEEDAKLSPDSDICIEMETGTGKTLVYLHTAYKLYKEYRLTKFIILVPSIAIKEGVLQSVEDFKKPLADRYGFTPACFEYDSSKLSRLKHFIEDTQPQIMVMTIQSITSDDRIINQPGRDDAFLGLTFLQALGQCRPVIIMDEPQEGMDTENAIARLATLNPLVKLRYSATHKVVKNLLYRLTPFDAYRDGMVKKIEVLSVAEKNDEATLKIEFSAVQTSGATIKAKLTVWRVNGDGFKWKATNWLKVGDNLGEKSANVSYRDYTIERIHGGKLAADGKWKVKFTNGVELTLKERNGDISGLFRQQLQWLRPDQLRSLAEMERTGGEPDVVGVKSGELVFMDCAPESPAGRRSVCYDREGWLSRKEARPKTTAMNMATEMGIALLTEADYFALQNVGEFDTKTSSWVKTPAEIRKHGGALYYERRYGRVFVGHNGAQSYYAVRGFRGSLRV